MEAGVEAAEVVEAAVEEVVEAAVEEAVEAGVEAVEAVEAAVAGPVAAAATVGSISIAAASGYSARTSELLREIVRGEASPAHDLTLTLTLMTACPNPHPNPNPNPNSNPAPAPDPNPNQVSAAHDGLQGAALDAAVESMLQPGGGVRVHELAGIAAARRSPTGDVRSNLPVDGARVRPTCDLQGGRQGRSPAVDVQLSSPANRRAPMPAKRTRADKNSMMLPPGQSDLMAEPEPVSEPGRGGGRLFALPEEADQPSASTSAIGPGAADEPPPPPPPPPPEARGSRRQLFAETAAPPGHPPADAAAATRRPDSWFPSWLSWGEPAAPTSGETASPARRHQRSGDEAARVLQARWRARRRARWQEVARRRRQRELVLFLAGQVRYLVITPLPG